MVRRSDIAWPRLFAEATAIVISILFAFSIDAWWDKSREFEDVRGVLLAVLEDLRTSKQRVNRGKSVSVARRGAITKLFDAAYDSGSELSGSRIDGLLSDLVSHQLERIIGDAGINALIFSGKFGSIKSDELRRDLAYWPANIEYMESHLARHRRFLESVWWPFMRDQGYQPQIMRRGMFLSGGPGSYSAFRFSPNLNFDHLPLLNDRKFHNILAQYWSIQDDIWRAYNDTDVWLDRSIRLLEDELQVEHRATTFLLDYETDLSED